MTETVDKTKPAEPAPRMEPVYKQIAGRLLQAENCRQSNNTEWLEKSLAIAEKLADNWLPSGGGFDSGTKLDLDSSTPEKLVFETSFHHMNDGGMYDGWSEHTVTVRPSLYFEISLKISGRDRNDIKEYIHEAFEMALTQKVEVI